MTWTVLGARGVIGGHLAARLRTTGEVVMTPGRDDGGLYETPLGHVVYAIGLTADFRQRPFDTVRAHVSLLSEILQRADFETLLYLSSTRVYMRAGHGSEESTLSLQSQDPSDLYNLSKLMGEALCFHCGRYGVRVARLSNVVGGEDAGSENFIPSLVRSARTGRVVLNTALDSAKDYIHIDDVADLLPQIATQGRERLYNVASGVQISHAQWMERLVALTGCAVEVTPGAPSVRFASVDTRRIQEEFGYFPRPVLSLLDVRAGPV